MAEPGKIKKLDEAVINRIAAGEVIQRPANALKELIENSLDAKASNIQITVKNGGLKLLQIQDNGTGIRKDDFPIVCERFTTSKLREFEDLNCIQTYGFRGEALASISHIAHLTITSKTKDDICAFQALFVDGVLQGKPKPIAGNQGTIITVEDLFFNMSVRKKALRSPAEEYQKVSEVVSKYAIHNSGVGFALKKHGENNDIRTPPKSTFIENIRTIYGNTIARELIEFSIENQPFKFKAHGFVTNPNFSTKKLLFLLFINHRLVDCPSLRKCIDHVYSTYLPKNTHPFVYLSLDLDPTSIDVNVHPTKHEVHFLSEDQIVEAISSALDAKLIGSNNSRVFYTQAKLPGVPVEKKIELKDKDNTIKTVNPKDFVRTDSSIQKLDKFFGAPVKKTTGAAKNNDVSITEEEFDRQHEEFLIRNENFEDKCLEKTIDMEVDEDEYQKSIPERSPVKNMNQKSPGKRCAENSPEKSSSTKNSPKKAYNPKSSLFINTISKLVRVETELTSILQLRKEVEANCHKSLRETFAQHVYVGPIDPTQSLIQYSTKLFLCNTKKILKELFYQFILYNFQNFGCISFEVPISIYELAMVCLDIPDTGWTPEDGPKEELAQKIKEILVEKAAILEAYFSMEIDEQGNLKTLPTLVGLESDRVLDYSFPKHRLATYEKGSYYSSIQFFNKLPLSLKSLKNNRTKFKNSLYNYICDLEPYSLEEFHSSV